MVYLCAGMVDTVSDAWRLGLGEPVAVSAATGEGLADLYAILQVRGQCAVKGNCVLALNTL